MNKIEKSIATLVNEGKISLSNAYVIVKLPPDEQINFVDRAMTMTTQKFASIVDARVKELRNVNY